ncbi:hypothetical protein A5699_10090 [Mycobacterium sp. E802]|nr:hypothetical protein A5699_10090 [Mycobacterium sp. E802]
MEHLADSRVYRKKLNTVKATGSKWPERAAISLPALLGAILLIEMHQRPGLIRAAEWIVSTTVPRCLRWPITRGPLQIADGPWDFELAVCTAYSILGQAVAGEDSEAAAITAAAVAWNGKAVRQPCSAYGYGEVLAYTYVIANRMLAEAAISQPTSLVQ